MDSVTGIAVSEPVATYVYQVVAATRDHEAIALGLSPRAALAWLRAARARAFLDARAYVLPDDLKARVHDAVAYSPLDMSSRLALALLPGGPAKRAAVVLGVGALVLGVAHARLWAAPEEEEVGLLGAALDALVPSSVRALLSPKVEAARWW